jgi:hypothetical protein
MLLALCAELEMTVSERNATAAIFEMAGRTSSVEVFIFISPENGLITGWRRRRSAGKPSVNRAMPSRAHVAGSGAGETAMLSTAKSVAVDEITIRLKGLPAKAISPSGKEKLFKNCPVAETAPMKLRVFIGGKRKGRGDAEVGGGKVQFHRRQVAAEVYRQREVVDTRRPGIAENISG